MSPRDSLSPRSLRNRLHHVATPKEEELDDDQEGKLWFSDSERLPREELINRKIAKELKMDITDVDKLSAQFATFDVDKSGEIDRVEFKALVMKLLKVQDAYDIPAERLEDFWRNVDTNRSGMISLEEFVELMHTFFGFGRAHVTRRPESRDAGRGGHGVGRQKAGDSHGVDRQRSRSGSSDDGTFERGYVGNMAAPDMNEERVNQIAHWHSSGSAHGRRPNS